MSMSSGDVVVLEPGVVGKDVELEEYDKVVKFDDDFTIGAGGPGLIVNTARDSRK